MKKLIVTAAIMAVTGVQAQELHFGDLNYFLKQGQFNLKADGYLASSRTTYNSPGAGHTEVQMEAYQFETRYAYAFTDRLNLFLGLDYNYKDYRKYVDGNRERYMQDGLKNPLLGANFRLVNQADSGVNVDVGVVATVRVEEAEVGYSDGVSAGDGNAANARNSYELNTRLGKKWDEANEFYLGLGAICNTSGEYTLKSSGTDRKVELERSASSYLLAGYQYRPVHEFMLGLNLRATRYESVKAMETRSRTSMSEKAHTDKTLGFDAKYMILPNFIAKFNYFQDLNPEYDSRALGVKTSVENRHSKRFGLGVDFIF